MAAEESTREARRNPPETSWWAVTKPALRHSLTSGTSTPVERIKFSGGLTTPQTGVPRARPDGNLGPPSYLFKTRLTPFAYGEFVCFQGTDDQLCCMNLGGSNLVIEGGYSTKSMPSADGAAGFLYFLPSTLPDTGNTVGLFSTIRRLGRTERPPGWYVGLAEVPGTARLADDSPRVAAQHLPTLPAWQSGTPDYGGTRKLRRTRSYPKVLCSRRSRNPEDSLSEKSAVGGATDPVRAAGTAW